MAVPKKKTSKVRSKTRRGAKKFKKVTTTECSKCGSTKRSHRACPECGFYKKADSDASADNQSEQNGE